jgi:hypothetical protein
MTPSPARLISHPTLGECELVRVEGTDWIIRPIPGTQLYRLPVSQRKGTTVQGSPSEAIVPPNGISMGVTNDTNSFAPKTFVEHPAYGRCERVRVEGTDWILRPLDGQTLVRLPASRHFQAKIVGDGPISSTGAENPRPQPPDPARADRRGLLRLFQSLRIGLEPRDAEARQLAVGIDPVLAEMHAFLDTVDEPGGDAFVLRGAYGQGKTFSLRVLRELALEQGFLVAQTEVDAAENQLDKPHHIYRDLIRNLQIPGEAETGVGALARVACRTARGHTWESLLKQLQCRPLAWLLSDIRLLDKPDLLRLLACEPGVNITAARRIHCRPGPNFSPDGPRYEWTQLSATTQGDFVSCLFSGIGRLSRLMGYRGLVLILDEMEKWEDLNWKAQSRAGNLLGGLIWAATSEEGRRNDHDRPAALMHSARNGGYPFTTLSRCHLGVAIALTPRGDYGPESLWASFGPLREVDLPELSASVLTAYVRKISPLYARAHGLLEPEIAEITVEARRQWVAIGDGSMRTAVQQVIAAFDAWRERVQPSSF